MTRREEIINNIGYKITKAAMEYYQANCANDVDLSDAFEAGAEWMQETMIEKAKQWLIRGGYFVNSNETIEDFCKAMQNE